MAKTIATVIGVVFLLAGIVGFFAPTMMGAHLNATHNVIHLVSGAVSLYIGTKGSLASARTFCIVFGLVYTLLGVVGFFAGIGESRMVELPTLMLGTMDHYIHIAIGVLYLVGGFLTKTGAPAAEA